MARERLAAIVDSSEDAILSKTLEGVIASWNGGAERLFGYQAADVIGRSVTILIPEERLHEEDLILGKIGRGERVEHFETVRRRKDGTLIDISLTVSPIRDPTGRVIGASKVARDITDRKRADERRDLLLREMNHRIKNLFALTDGLITLSQRTVVTADELASALRGRIATLARAHELTLPDLTRESTDQRATTLFALIEAILAPHISAFSQVEIHGEDVPVSGRVLASLALVFHEFATNAAKYGALSSAGGRLSVESTVEDDTLHLTWLERGGREPLAEPSTGGFGSKLERMTIHGMLGGELARERTGDGMIIRLRIPTQRLVT